MYYRKPSLPYCHIDHSHDSEKDVSNMMGRLDVSAQEEEPITDQQRTHYRSVTFDPNQSEYALQRSKVTVDGKDAQGILDSDSNSLLTRRPANSEPGNRGYKQQVYSPPYEQTVYNDTVKTSFDKLPSIESKTSAKNKQHRERTLSYPPMTYDHYSNKCQGCIDLYAKRMIKELYGQKPKSYNEILTENSRLPKTLSWHMKKQQEYDFANASLYDAQKRSKGYFIIHPDFVSEKNNIERTRTKKKTDAKYWGETKVKETHTRGSLLPYIGGSRKGDYA